METIDLTEKFSNESVYHFLIAAFTNNPKIPVSETGSYNIEFKINGVDVPFNTVINEVYERFISDRDRAANEMAEQLIDEKFRTLNDLLYDTEKTLKKISHERFGISED